MKEHKESKKSICNSIIKAVKLDIINAKIVTKDTIDEPNDEIGLNDKDINFILELLKRKNPDKYNDVKDSLKRKMNSIKCCIMSCIVIENIKICIYNALYRYQIY